MVEITNREELEAWLEGQPREVAVAIAVRSALRSFPTLSQTIEIWPDVRQPNFDVPLLFRGLITSAVAIFLPTQEVEAINFRNASALTTQAAFAVKADKAGIAAAFAANAANAGYVANALASVVNGASAIVSSAYSAVFWKAVERDATMLEGAFKALKHMREPIWSTGIPDDLIGPTQDFLAKLLSFPALSFWARWYERMAAGDPPNWEMQKEIALIPDRDWRKGAEHVSGLIAEIEAKYAPKLDAEKLSEAAERLYRSPASTQHMSLSARTEMERVVSEFKASCGNPNSLPDELRPLEDIPLIFARFGEIAGKIDAKDAQIEAHKRTIELLHAKIAELEENLATAQSGVFSDKFKEAIAKSIIDPLWYRRWGVNLAAMGGMAVFGYSYFNNPAVSSETVEHIFECIEEIRSIEPEKAKTFDLPQKEVDPGSSPG